MMSRMTFWPVHASTICAAGPARCRPRRAASGLAVDDVEDALAERVDQLARENGADALMRPDPR